MTPRENLLRSMRRQGYETVPCASGEFCESQVEAFKQRFGHEDYAEWFGNPYRSVGTEMTATYQDPFKLYKHEQLPEDIHFDVWGVGHSRRPGCWHMTHMHHPLQGEDLPMATLDDYPVPCLTPDQLPSLKRKVQSVHAQGLAVMASMACTIWERSWYLRSMEDLMADMMMDDPKAGVLLDRVTNHAIETIKLYTEAGCDIMQCGDDIGMQQSVMMSVDLWRTWLKPRLKSVIDAARSVNPDVLIFYHSCGYVLPFLDDLIEIGVDILNPVQPECMDFADVLARTKGQLSYWGTIGTQQVLPFGTPDEVREVVQNNVRLCGDEGGILIAPTHMVEPEVPWENLVAMRQAALDYPS